MVEESATSVDDDLFSALTQLSGRPDYVVQDWVSTMSRSGLERTGEVQALSDEIFDHFLERLDNEPSFKDILLQLRKVRVIVEPEPEDEEGLEDEENSLPPGDSDKENRDPDDS